MGKPVLFSSFFAASVFAVGIVFGAAAQQAPAPAQQPSAPSTAAPSTAVSNQAPVPPAPVASGPVIVIDPAHGGTDSGAHGDIATEKDVVLQLGRAVLAALERQGFRVVLTRNDDSSPSYDDRAAMANGYRDAIFVSLHASSTGAVGTVHAYYMQFASPIEAGQPPAVSNAPAAKPATAVSLARWEEAQRPYALASHRLADLLQGDFAQAFAGSPPYSAGVPVRALRSVAAPAVAVEVSSVAATPDQLAALGDPLGNAIARAVIAFRQSSGAGH